MASRHRLPPRQTAAGHVEVSPRPLRPRPSCGRAPRLVRRPHSVATCRGRAAGRRARSARGLRAGRAAGEPGARKMGGELRAWGTRGGAPAAARHGRRGPGTAGKEPLAGAAALQRPLPAGARPDCKDAEGGPCRGRLGLQRPLTAQRAPDCAAWAAPQCAAVHADYFQGRAIKPQRTREGLLIARLVDCPKNSDGEPAPGGELSRGQAGLNTRQTSRHAGQSCITKH